MQIKYVLAALLAWGSTIQYMLLLTGIIAIAPGYHQYLAVIIIRGEKHKEKEMNLLFECQKNQDHTSHIERVLQTP